MIDRRPFILGLGGTFSAGSSTQQALALALEAARDAGADTAIFGAERLVTLPLYGTIPTEASEAAASLVALMRRADGVVIASPGYHGSVSGLIKNALDFFEETARDERVYLDGVPVGLIATAYGWQATGSTLAALRSIVHALRGWPSPLGAAINSAARPFDGGACVDGRVAEQLRTVGRQVCRFAMLHMEDRDATAVG